MTAASGWSSNADQRPKQKLSFALDAGLLFTDGQPIFGRSKTVRGIAASLVVTAVAALVIDQSLAIGLLGGKYMELTPGGDTELLVDQGKITFTQSAILLENLIGKYMLNGAAE